MNVFKAMKKRTSDLSYHYLLIANAGKSFRSRQVFGLLLLTVSGVLVAELLHKV
jgi:hypothetical protein